MVVDVPALEGEKEKQIGSPIKFSQSTPQHSHTGPPVGMNTEEILLEAGFNSESVQSFINDGALFQETDKKL
jgi:crotonobetainyl-CoA:carnitine CoA-transferase CaiB-like acyl-CoA transferase